VQQAIKMTTTGQRLDATRAKKAGLVDAVADPWALEHAARVAALGLADGSIKSTRKSVSMLSMQGLLEGNPLGRQALWHFAQQGVDKAAPKTAYPSVHAILSVIKAGVEGGKVKGLEAEASEFGRLGMTSQSRALRGLFFGQQGTKSHADYPKPTGSENKPRRVAVLGAGLMGAGVAEVTAYKAGTQVVLKDMTSDGLARG